MARLESTDLVWFWVDRKNGKLPMMVVAYYGQYEQIKEEEKHWKSYVSAPFLHKTDFEEQIFRRLPADQRENYKFMDLRGKAQKKGWLKSFMEFFKR